MIGTMTIVVDNKCFQRKYQIILLKIYNHLVYHLLNITHTTHITE